MGSSPIDTYEGADVVFTFGAASFGTVLFFVLSCLAFIAFMVRVALHEKHAYAAIVAHKPPEPGPAVEGEPEVAAV
ncbi:MAG: hypothetical protein JHD16_14740 [Solirubrobacteraceae bacterium]|nr:hypothetical protein [Solirubrobacteraceae bacterium]